MKLVLSGKEFQLRADFLAFKQAKEEAGIELNNMSDNPVEVGTLVYFMARSGAKRAEIPFKYKLDDFLALIDFKNVSAMSAALEQLLSLGTEKKS